MIDTAIKPDEQNLGTGQHGPAKTVRESGAPVQTGTHRLMIWMGVVSGMPAVRAAPRAK